MSQVGELMASIDFRLDNIDLCGVDPDPKEPWSYELDEPALLLLRIRDDMDDLMRAKSDAEAHEIWEQIRAFILTFHVGAMN